jgi:hypothetical protein
MMIIYRVAILLLVVIGSAFAATGTYEVANTGFPGYVSFLFILILLLFIYFSLRVLTQVTLLLFILIGLNVKCLYGITSSESHLLHLYLVILQAW